MSKRVNIDSNIWGSKGWFFLDSTILGYPDKPNPDEMLAFKNFLSSLQIVLPCHKCRIHFTEYIKKNPLTNSILSSKKKLVEWILECHNNVRKLTNKEVLTIDDFYNYYSKHINLEINKETSEVKEGKNKKNKNNNIYYVIIIIIILILILIYKN